MGDQLHTAGVPFVYEGAWVPYDVPSRTAKYLPDFRVGNIILEVKGWFGRQGAKERQKLVLLKEQHPDLDIKLVFTDSKKRIYKTSPTTYAMWADDHGFLWADKGTIPAEWLRDLKRELKRCKPSTSK